MNSSMKMGLVKVTLFSILIVLSGMTAIASADNGHEVSMFYGNITLNGADASPGTVVNAYIDGKLRWGRVTDTSGKYFIDIIGNGSEDDGKAITFEVCGATADQTAVWHASYRPGLLDLTAVDDEAPAVTNANANPASIVADGAETTLNVTITDGCSCTVGHVTVDLSAIGGDTAQVMNRVGDTDVYSVTLPAAEGTAGEHCLYVNASDVFGKCNTSVCIGLEVTTTELPKTGDIDGSDGITMNDVIYLAKHFYGPELFPDYATIYADGDIDCDGDLTMNDVIYLAKHFYGPELFPDYGTLYPCE
ncbi:MAG: hypothetical protein U9N36_10085 [Euryarchaeota archaeon]|nr:hypothetical protein [Euryarchaeota archaeon]